MKYRKNFGESLKSARQQARHSQNELVALVNKNLGLEGTDGLTQPTLSAWETGRQMPSGHKESQVREVARLLELDFDVLTHQMSFEDEDIVPLTADSLEMASRIMKVLDCEISGADLLLLVRLCQRIRGRTSA